MNNTTPTPPAEYNNLWHYVKNANMILANNAESHLEENFALYEALQEYNRNQYEQLTIKTLIDDYGFTTDIKLTKEILNSPYIELYLIDDTNELEEEISEWISEQNFNEIYQTFIVDEQTQDIFKDYGYPVWYNEDMQLYFVGITHYGTAWDYVMNTELPIHNKEEYLSY